MVLIISEELDPSTCRVMDWLHFKGFQVKRINGKTFFSNEYIQTITGESQEARFIYKNDTTFDAQKVTSIWYRRDELPKLLDRYSEVLKLEINSVKIDKYLNLEIASAKQALFAGINQSIKKLGHYIYNKRQKIEMLLMAKKNNLQIPDTIITTSKKELIKFKKERSIIISKSIDNYINIEINGDKYSFFTEVISQDLIEKLPDIFFPTLFQQKIEKVFDIRIFFIEGNFYSMAIFSEAKSKNIDFRKNIARRHVPFDLPKDIQKKINGLMNNLALNTGSIDLILDENDNFIFLEVNPVGQYDMVGTSCNYYLDKVIAEFLIN